jgi:periplasmic protein TonB
MKQEHEVAKNWDDLVFEHKNKAYGAYLVRKSYSQNLTTGLGVSVCLACIILIAPKVFSELFPSQQIITDIKEDVYDGTVLTQPPSFEPPRTQPAPPVQRTNTNFPPAVTTEPVDDVTPTVDQINTSLDNVTPGPGTVPGPSEPVGATVAPPVEPSEFITAEVMPAYTGGLQAMYQFISRKLKYPRVAQRNGTEGTVFVTFVISKEGKVTNISTLKGISEECDKEAMRVIALLDQWTPGSQNHRAVNVRMTIPIKFQLEK